MPSISSGGHFYTYDTMHLTEATLHFDKLTESKHTNHEHNSPLLTMSHMINFMGENGRNGKLLLPILIFLLFSRVSSLTPLPVYPRKSLAALCRMVTADPLTYFATKWKDPDLAAKRFASLKPNDTRKTLQKRIPRLRDEEQARKNATMLMKRLELTYMIDPPSDESPNSPMHRAFYDPGQTVNISKVKKHLKQP